MYATEIALSSNSSFESTLLFYNQVTLLRRCFSHFLDQRNISCTHKSPNISCCKVWNITVSTFQPNHQYGPTAHIRKRSKGILSKFTFLFSSISISFFVLYFLAYMRMFQIIVRVINYFIQNLQFKLKSKAKIIKCLR